MILYTLFLRFLWISKTVCKRENKETELDSIPVGCVLSTTSGPQVNKFEQVSSDDHQMSVAGRGGEYPCPLSRGRIGTYHG